MPTLHLVFGGDGDGELSLISAEMPPRIAELSSGMPDAAGPAYCSIDRDNPRPSIRIGSSSASTRCPTIC
jgi:hypothetical protein